MKRILLKISGEALSSQDVSIDPNRVEQLAEMIMNLKKTGLELVLVLGGGNIYRGSQLIKAGVDASESHNMSMLSTVFNSVTLKSFLESKGLEPIVLDALWVGFLEKYTAIQSRKYLQEWKIVICSSGTGAPFFTTDTGGVLRALEANCDAMIKLTKVDGVYDSDPMIHTNARKIDALSYDDFIHKDLKVLDQTGVIMARDNNLPIYVSRLDDIESIYAIIEWKNAGTKIC